MSISSRTVMMESPMETAAFLPTVKCSSCAADIKLSAIAEHVCTRSALQPDSILNSNSLPINQAQYELRQRAPLLPKANRPVLPKLDSSLTSRSGLRPSEAASIAHDLGLPSPLSAGTSGHRSPRSRSRSRKASIPRPLSPEGPISQDCAFPAFPIKPKRSQAEKDARTHKSHSTNRSTTSTKTYQHSSSPSTSSSIYSNGSGPTKRRTSNTSSSHRSRQGTIDEAMSSPSTAPSSPRQSVLSPLSREQSTDHTQQLPALILSPSNTISEPNSSASTMPSTPSWPFDTGEPSPKILQSPPSDVGWTPTESTIPEEQSFGPEAAVPSAAENQMATRNKKETSNKALLPVNQDSHVNMFDNPPKEPLYKTKRPTPLLQPQRSVTDDPQMPLSARGPPPPAHSGITRTLTNLFGRKRSQSSSAKTMPLPSFDSPRMKALAPDPPERPKRGEGLWDTAIPIEEPTRTFSPVASLKVESPSYVNGTFTAKGDKSEVKNGLRNHERDYETPEETIAFNFSFGGESGPELTGSHALDNRDENHDSTSLAVHDNTHPKATQFQDDLHRASIDSASSYGSIGFSNRTISSRSSHPMSTEIQGKVSATQEPNEPPKTSIDSIEPPTSHFDEHIPDSPTDPLYYAGKLSPVPESERLHWSNISGLERPLPKTSLPPEPEATLQEHSRNIRPTTPAGIKGRCRGCSNIILAGQKSVASADGRLTGRYHKDCFACQTCNEAFATADFYVFNDQPYCAHHYHVLNNTLCTGCGKGIEGQYLETYDVAGSCSKKFHSKCLQCSTCKAQLNEDYFEYHGRVYCERDAFRAANSPRSPYATVPSRPSPLVREYINSEEPGLKGRFPERRTTRLIMT